jgi:cytochrome c oxidase assembly protein subunit 11
MNRNRITVLALLAVLAAMGGLVSVSVPLYRLFCQATGYGGTTQRATAAPLHEVADRVVTVRFNAMTAPDLPWDFAPVQRQVTVHPGEEKIVAFRAINRSAQTVVGKAIYNVTPNKAGLYFDKLQCFCFSQQSLAPGASVDMTVQFFVDPGIVTDPNTSDVDTITLSYTMFRAKNDDSPSASVARPGNASVN